MADAPITSKRQMYALLASGQLGNTIAQYFDLEAWEASEECQRYPVWGVRTLTPGGPCRLYCPREEVRATAERPEYRRAGVNISVMVDAIATVTLFADVYDAPGGLLVYGVEYPTRGLGTEASPAGQRGVSWRQAMPSRGREFRGLAARLLLAKHLNASSLADLYALFDRWPGHVAEVSAFDRCFGTVPGRNGIHWELRNY